MNESQFQYAVIKAYSKKYKTKNGTVKESISNMINLGATTIFKDGDNVVIIYESDFNELLDSSEKDDEMEELKSQLKEYSKKFQELERNYELLFQEFQELKNERNSFLKQLNDANDVKENLHNALHKAQSEIDIKNNIITAYEHMGLWNRIRHYNPKQDIEMLDIPSDD